MTDDARQCGFWCRTLKRRDPELHGYIYAMWSDKPGFMAGYKGETL